MRCFPAMEAKFTALMRQGHEYVKGRLRRGGTTHLAALTRTGSASAHLATKQGDEHRRADQRHHRTDRQFARLRHRAADEVGQAQQRSTRPVLRRARRYDDRWCRTASAPCVRGLINPTNPIMPPPITAIDVSAALAQNTPTRAEPAARGSLWRFAARRMPSAHSASGHRSAGGHQSERSGGDEFERWTLCPTQIASKAKTPCPAADRCRRASKAP